MQVVKKSNRGAESAETYHRGIESRIPAYLDDLSVKRSIRVDLRLVLLHFEERLVVVVVGDFHANGHESSAT